MNSKKSILLLFVAASSLAASAQSLCLSQGEVTVVHSSANTGDMVFGSNSLTIEGKYKIKTTFRQNQGTAERSSHSS
jgi:hypothetical protein